MGSSPYKRRAEKAGVWYESERAILTAQFDRWFSEALSSPDAPNTETRSAEAIGSICPHAGYTFAGKTLSRSLAPLLHRLKRDPGSVSRIIILGPSHHIRIEGCAVFPDCTAAETPLGDLAVDARTAALLAASSAGSQGHDNHHHHRHNSGEISGPFSAEIARRSDLEREHSIEMILPALKYVLEEGGAGRVPIVPVIVGGGGDALAGAAKILSEHCSRESDFWIVSSDFCHYGERFGYAPLPPAGVETHAFIKDLDSGAMREIASLEEPRFAAFVEKTRVTVCGRNPIRIAMIALRGRAKAVDWVDYSQSSQCRGPQDSSVSYAAGVFRA